MAAGRHTHGRRRGCKGNPSGDSGRDDRRSRRGDSAHAVPQAVVAWQPSASLCAYRRVAAPEHQSLELARLLPTGRNNPALSRDKAGLFSNKAGLLPNKAGLLDSGQYWTVDYKDFSRVPRVCAVRVRSFLEVLSTDPSNVS